MVDLLLNIAFFLLLALCIWGLAIRGQAARTVSRVRLAKTLAPSLLAWVLLPLLAEDTFGLLRLLAWGVFVHVPFLLVLAVWLRRRRDRSTAVGLGTAVIIVAIGGWSFFVEPTRLQVNTISIDTVSLEQGIDIAVLTDFQTDQIGAYERRVLASLSALDADLILLTGDYLQVEAAKRPALRAAFEAAWLEAGIDPPLGVFAVQGNTDPASWPKLFAELDVTLLDDALAESQALSDLGIELLGLSLEKSFRTSRRTFPATDSGSPRIPGNGDEPFRIVFGHGPDYALGLAGADLMVAGHTHGGQVQLPFVGPLITFSHVPRSWAAGATAMPDGSTLVVSRGTGMERGHAPRMRFLCPPELVLIRLHPR